VHSKSLKFGVYTDRGNFTCGRRPGSAGYEKIDAQTYAQWGVDFVKEDSCDATQDHQTAFHEYALMRDAMNATGRPMYFDVCGWSSWYAPVGQSLGNEWRIGPDDTNWSGVLTNINIDAGLAEYAGPGGWNNPCLLLGQTYNGENRVTPLQSRTQFNMWSILAAPLVLSLNIRNLSTYLIETYTNVEVIAVDQDLLGKQGIRLYGGDLILNSANRMNYVNVFGRQLSGGSWAIVFINIGSMSEDIICDAVCFGRTGLEPTTKLSARDLWTHKDLGLITAASYTALNVPPNGGSVMLKLTPAL